jgi:sulfonate transport system substrate-binding protein
MPHASHPGSPDSPIKSAADLRASDWPARGRLGPVLINATLEGGAQTRRATFAPLSPVDAKIALVAGWIDG